MADARKKRAAFAKCDPGPGAERNRRDNPALIVNDGGSVRAVTSAAFFK